jgi:DNA-binding MarR family transcriptional regulator
MAASRHRLKSGIKTHENAHLYAAKPDSSEGVAVVAALQKLGDAVQQAEDRTVIELGMSRADVLATRYLLQAERDDQHLTTTDLGALMGVTTAAASKLVDRLVAAGRAERLPHPTDKRALIVSPTPAAQADIRASYARLHSPLVEAVNGLSAPEASIIERFATKLAAALAASLSTT